MKKNKLKMMALLFTFTLTWMVTLTGCSQSNNNQNGNDLSNRANNTQSAVNSSSNNSSLSSNDVVKATELEVCFGDNGKPFTMHLYDNDTAAAIARHVGTTNWRLPIYHYNDYENWEVMQYYDIPSRYDIPSNPEMITSEKAGEVYYSSPNRIVLFFGDAQVQGEYTKVGYFDYTEEFKTAVENNPVLEGWGNKIVLINHVN